MANPYPFKTRPFKYQREALKKLLTLPSGGALLMEPGTGKTKVAIDYASALYILKRARRVLVVCPLSVIGVWEDELSAHCPLPYGYTRMDGLDAHKRSQAVLLASLDDRPEFITFLLVNYDSAWRTPSLQGWADLVIVDESHYIKSPTSRRSKGLHRIGEGARYRVIMTGTPLAKNPLDLWSQWRFLEPEVFGRSYRRFRDRYAVMGGFKGYQVMGYEHLDEIAEEVRKRGYRKRKAECLDLPEVMHQRVPVRLPPKAQELYNEMRDEMVIELEGEEVTAPIVLTKMLRLQQITSGFVKTDEGTIKWIHHEKVKSAANLIQSLVEQGQQVVVFGRFLPEVRATAKRAREAGLSVALMEGSTPAKMRDTMRRQFMAGKVDVFVAQIATGGLGINLHSAANVIFLSVDFSLATYTQACDRVHRIGQEQKVTYHHLTAPRTIDTYIYRALQKKADIQTLVLDNWRQILKEEK